MLFTHENERSTLKDHSIETSVTNTSGKMRLVKLRSYKNLLLHLFIASINFINMLYGEV